MMRININKFFLPFMMEAQFLC
uniref:Uncharacterized protein n=1 Tax=Rhizophora mucronata TaxID=61149 RepID=A0A2P2QF64_RHIMU